ncbi:hypothetical protein ACJJTC_007878 [Scirpophaga incertulas]
MAIYLILFLFFVTKSTFMVTSKYIYNKTAELKLDNNYAHLNKTFIINSCKSRDSICKSNDSIVCALRIQDGEEDYKTFNNSCYLFFSNMCEHPGEEYNIIEDDSCQSHLPNRAFRRDSNETTTLKPVATTPGTAFDDRICPISCPNVYSPICLIVNQGQGKYFKFFSFANHCLSAMFYCKHPEEFTPAPDWYEDVKSSPLGWSYCSAYRYLQFNRFAEVASSMGHSGWLGGNQKYSHIMEGNERIPGFG